MPSAPLRCRAGIAERVFALLAIVAPSVVAQPAAGDDEAYQPVERADTPLEVATDTGPPDGPPPPVQTTFPPYERGWHRGRALGAAFGAAFVAGVDRGYYGRIELSGYRVQTRRRGFILGVLAGLEGWTAKGSERGAGLPLVGYAGVQSDALFLTIGGGFDVALVDRVAARTGVGFFAPLAATNLGFDLEGVRFLIDGRAGYRWQLGADDRRMLQLGGAIQLTTD